MLKNFFKKIKDTLNTPVEDLFKKDKWNWDDIEEILLENDISYDIVDYIIEKLKKGKYKTPDELKSALKEILLSIIDIEAEEKEIKDPHVYLFVGVNGTGKTTSIGKLASILKNEGKKVLVVAADTFRPAAIQQLEIWANRSGVDILKSHPGADPAALVYDSIVSAKSKGYDTVLVDTAGRMHTNDNLMREMEKIYRVIKKISPENPYKTLIVIDAVTGKNALSQAKNFQKVMPIDGIVLTKLDGTATGGTVISIVYELKIPVLYAGTGESIEDFEPFSPESFIDAIIGG